MLSRNDEKWKTNYVALKAYVDGHHHLPPEERADWMMAQHATQCALSFMSLFIVIYMKLNPEVKEMYDKMEFPWRFAIGMYEDAMRGEHTFR